MICITTNGVVDSNGRAVVGRGIAEQAVRRFPDLSVRLARVLRDRGNVVATLGTHLTIMSFPVRHHWRRPAIPELIRESALELARIVNDNPEKVYVLPRPGCGNGWLKWGDVKSLTERVLPDNVHVITL